MKKQILSFASLVSLSPALWAHSGEHHGFGATLWHVLSQADHLLGIITGSVLTLAVIVGAFKIKRRMQKTKKLLPSSR